MKLALALVAVSAIAIETLQPSLSRTAHKATLRDDVILVPPSENIRALSLGYHAATADLLWAKLLLEYGTHWQEKRPFPDITRYIDAILAVDDSFAPLFRYVDTLIVYRPPVGTEDDARTARHYLERGLQTRPGDADLWLKYGQFLAFTGPSFLHDSAEVEAWRKEGAFAMTRAVELGASVGRSLSAASLLSRAGERNASIAFLERAYALTDDPSERDQIAAKLRELAVDALRDGEQNEAARSAAFVESRWRRSSPFLTRGEFLLLGPPHDAAACTGPAHADSKECTNSWDRAFNAH